ncbi:hypothetical protein EDD75_0348 [Thermodesulfitimonas autotrophica]|uniref:Uncharacterized protein n=1 Tax=Thermodesulfitimonas autotrophica TaxID=1894989 RepID=A0A3N5BPI1_9THEO|nr:hypothetical protein [Thermodesulfitimonas autotrophica]RPF49532.1 hypothetical protein EDD75_0348 [Thermodesulfitimonas autotrophica]
MTAVLHIYAQTSHHDDAFIVGNRQGLLALRRAIDAALESGQSKDSVFVSDGEGFDVYVILQEGDLQSPGWIAAAVPYTAEWAAETRGNAVWPWDKLTKEEQKLVEEEGLA